MSQKISLVLYGNTGAGKSTLGNTLLGHLNEFKESNQVESETKVTISKEGQFNNLITSVTDTPGLQDAENEDQIHLKQMIDFIRNKPDIQAFVIVINYGNVKLDMSLRKLFLILDNMYHGKKWYYHIAILWSNYHKNIPENLRDIEPKKSGFKRFLKAHILPNISEEELNKIPQFFIDSIEAREEDSTCRKKLEHLLLWINELSPIQQNLGEIVDVDHVIRAKEEEIERNRIIKEETEGNTKKITYADFKRYKRFHYDETISFSDWEEIKGTKKGKDTKTELKTISGEIKVVDSSWNEKKRFIGICIKNDHHEVGHYYVEKCEITEEREWKENDKGEIITGDWKEIKRGKVQQITTGSYQF